MNPEEELEYWRKHLCCDEAVKRQLAEEYANAESEDRIKSLDKISEIINNKN